MIMNRYKWLIIHVYIDMMLRYIDQLELCSASDMLFTIRYRTFGKKYLYFPHLSIPDRLHDIKSTKHESR